VAKSRIGEVYATAARLFEQRGYDATSIQDIADELGVLKGSLYYYFSSKEELLYQILLDWQAASVPELERYSSFEATPPEQVRYMIKGYVKWTIEYRRYVALFEREYRSLSPEHQTELVPVRDQFEALLRRLIQNGQDQGLFREEVDVKLTTISIFSMINGVPMWYRPRGGYTADKISTVYAENAVRLLMKSEAAVLAGS
jgi:AcrR family transcriptional regulator